MTGPTPCVLAVFALLAGCYDPTSVEPDVPASSSSSTSEATLTSTSEPGDASNDDGVANGTSDSGAVAESSTGAESSSSGGSDSTDSGDGGAVACDPFAPVCAAGRKCTATGTVAWEEFLCLPIDANPVGVGDPCVTENASSGIDNCDAGSICADVDPTSLAGTCVAFCGGTAEEPVCAESEQCVVYEELVPLCRYVSPGCGNGEISPGEQCDGEDLQGFDCMSLGLQGGELLCSPLTCTFDTSMCTAA